MKKQFNQVIQFHRAVGAFIGLRISSDISQDVKDARIKLIREETDELIQAINKEGVKEIAKELCDVLYVVFGTAISFGLHNNLVQIFTEVHTSNMSKIDKKGNFEMSDDKSKILKGAKYHKPNIDWVIDDKK